MSHAGASKTKFLTGEIRCVRLSQNLSVWEHLMCCPDFFFFFFSNAQHEQFLTSELNSWFSKSLVPRHQTHFFFRVGDNVQNLPEPGVEVLGPHKVTLPNRPSEGEGVSENRARRWPSPWSSLPCPTLKGEERDQSPVPCGY